MSVPITISALQEIDKIKREKIDLLEKERYYERKYADSGYKEKIYRIEANKIHNKGYKLDEKIDEIEKHGISTKEMSKLKKELIDFFCITREKELGSSNYVKIGFSKTLQEYLYVRYDKFSSFMRNVRGCGSLAGTYSIYEIRIISREEYEKVAGGK